MQIVFVLDVTVDVWLGAGVRVEVPRPLSCPSCGHVTVNFDGWYPRHIRRGRMSIRRVLCTNEGCGQRSHSLLPDVLVPGRVDLASVVGWALEARASGLGYRPIAEWLRVPATTQVADAVHQLLEAAAAGAAVDRCGALETAVTQTQRSDRPGRPDFFPTQSHGIPRPALRPPRDRGSRDQPLWRTRHQAGPQAPATSASC